MKLDPQQSLVLLIDIQTKLAPAIAQSEVIQAAAEWTLQVATELQIPCLATEQYPQGLGLTLPQLRRYFQPTHIIEKIHFSALQEPQFCQQLQQQGRRQLVMLGTESHVCVLQTALDAIAAGYQVFLLEEAIGSRTAANKQLALQRLVQAGCVLISCEMLVFEWLQQAGTPQFRRLLQGWIR